MTGVRHDSYPQPLTGTHKTPRPRLLFLCQTLPFPPDGGVQIRTYNVLRLLAQVFDITALVFYRRATRPTNRDIANGLAGLRPLGEVEAFPIPQEHSTWRLLYDHMRSITNGRVYTWYAYDSAAFRHRLRKLLSDGHFAVVHVDSLDLARYLPLLGQLPVVCTHHNVESDLLKQRAAMQRSKVKRLYLRLQARLMEAEERRWCPKVSFNAVVSPADAARLQRIAPSAQVRIVPNGVDTVAFQPVVDSSKTTVVFVGGHSWYPNRDAMTYFIREILPRVRLAVPACSLTWVGRVPAGFADRYSHDEVRVTGYVPDIRPFVADAACYVVPLRIGGGTRLKILDAWAMGKAVVSTSIGCEGLDVTEGQNILIRDTPETFAEAICSVLVDTDLRRRLGDNGRTTVEHSYAWDVVGPRMLRDYLQLVATVAPATISTHNHTLRGTFC